MDDELLNLKEQLQATQRLLAELQSKQTQPPPTEKITAPTLKLNNPPPFNGKTSLDSWIFQVENFLKGHAGVTDQQAIIYASSLLEREASVWWRAQTLDEENFKKLSSEWESFKLSITSYFRPANSKKQARDQLAALKQRTSVRAYATEFKRLLLEIGNVSKDESLDRFVRGLKFSVRKEVELREPVDLSQAISISERYDSISFALSRNWASANNENPRGGSSVHTPMEINRVKIPKLTEELKAELIKEGKCFFCRKAGHMLRDCPIRPPKN